MTGGKLWSKWFSKKTIFSKYGTWQNYFQFITTKAIMMKGHFQVIFMIISTLGSNLRMSNQVSKKKLEYLVLSTYLRIVSCSSHIRSILIGDEYRNCSRTLDVYLFFAILLGQIKSKIYYRLLNHKLASP